MVFLTLTIYNEFSHLHPFRGMSGGGANGGEMTNGGWGEERSYKQRSLKKTKMRTDSLNNFLSNKW